MAQTVKNLPAMQETRVRALGWEDPLEKGMATYSSILAWRTPWTEEPGGLYSPWCCKELDMTEGLTHPRHVRKTNSPGKMESTRNIEALEITSFMKIYIWLYFVRYFPKNNGPRDQKHICKLFVTENKWV